MTMGNRANLVIVENGQWQLVFDVDQIVWSR